MPGGRLQAFGIAWDSRPKAEGGQRWFDLYPGQHLKPGNPLHWTGIQQTANFMCIDCHVTNFRKGFDAAQRTYNSTWSELGVGCEACHGPGANHVAWAQSGKPAGDARRSLPATFRPQASIAWGSDPAKRPARAAAGRRADRRIAGLRALPRPAFAADRRYPRRAALRRCLSARPARPRPLSRRRPDAGRGVQSRLVPAKPHVRQGRDLQQLPRAAQPEAAGRGQRAVRSVP